MFTAITTQIKIFWSIIKSVPIFVVDNFFRFQISSKHFFHYKAVFSNISLFSGKRMVFFHNIIIRFLLSAFSAISQNFSPLPTGMFFWRNLFQKFVFTGSRTKKFYTWSFLLPISNITIPFLKFFFTIWADESSYSHISWAWNSIFEPAPIYSTFRNTLWHIKYNCITTQCSNQGGIVNGKRLLDN